MAKEVTLVSKDGEYSLSFDPDVDAVEITNYRAAGWATKPELKEAEKAEKRASQ